jgi:hypothetical protein
VKNVASSSSAKHMHLGACYRFESALDESRRAGSSTTSSQLPVKAPKRARHIACYGVDGHSISLINPDLSDARQQGALRSFALGATESLSAAPLTLITPAPLPHDSDASRKGKEPASPSGNTNRRSKRNLLRTIVCVVKGANETYIRVHDCILGDRFLPPADGLDLSEDNVTTIDLPARITHLYPLDEKTILCRTQTGSYREVRVEASSVSEREIPSAAQHGSFLQETVFRPDSRDQDGADLNTYLLSVHALKTSANRSPKKGKLPATKGDSVLISLSKLSLTPDARLALDKPVIYEIPVHEGSTAIDASIHRSGTVSVLSEWKASRR